jgi:ubiquinone biosynthesis protein Coq4
MKTAFLEWRGRLLVQTVEVIKPIYAFLFQQNKRPWDTTLAELRTFPGGSLGRELAAFIDEEGFELLPLYESHDVYHLLLNYPTTVPGEGAMQACLLGNGKRSPAVFITVFFSFLLLPEYSRYFIRAWKHGRRIRPIGDWQFEHLLYEPVADLISFIHFQPTRTTGYIF